MHKFQTIIRWTVPTARVEALLPGYRGLGRIGEFGGQVVNATDREIVISFDREVRAHSQGQAADAAFSYAHHAMAQIGEDGLGATEDDVTFNVWHRDAVEAASKAVAAAPREAPLASVARARAARLNVVMPPSGRGRRPGYR